jgi:hypothetical protein
VQDLTGLAGAGASTTVCGPAQRNLPAGEDGRFVVESLPDGKYAITARLEGFAPGSRSIEIVNGSTAAVALILVPEILEQVTVTADKTGQRELQNIAMAVSVLWQAQLTQREAHTVPIWLAWHRASSSRRTRVLAADYPRNWEPAAFAGSDPSSAAYIDGVYIARPAAVLTEFLDLDRVEALRGPQGTLYGHNDRRTTRHHLGRVGCSRSRTAIGRPPSLPAQVNAAGLECSSP